MRLNRFVYPLALIGLVSGPGSTARVHAQTMGKTVVVQGVTDSEGSIARAADVMESALLTRRVHLISRHEARGRVLATSRLPTPPTADDAAVIARDTDVAIEHLAFGRTTAARRMVEGVLSRSERSMETLHRETRAARSVLDACLGLVRADLQRRKRHDALGQAMACRRLVPDLAPSESLHPADVVGVVAEADDQLRRMRLGPIIVQSKPGEGCSVYANGRHVGTTPFTFERIAPGEYRIQLECSGIASRRRRVFLSQGHRTFGRAAHQRRVSTSSAPARALATAPAPSVDALAER